MHKTTIQMLDRFVGWVGRNIVSKFDINQTTNNQTTNIVSKPPFFCFYSLLLFFSTHYPINNNINLSHLD